MITIRMSSSGYCSKRLSAMLLGQSGESAPRWLASSASEGNWHETRMKSELMEAGCDVIDDQLELVTRGEGYTAIGHIDGRIKLSPKLFDSSLFTFHYIDCSKADLDFELYHLLEVKSFSFLEHQRWISEGFEGYFRSYACQHTSYRHSMGEHISVLATKDRSGGARNIYFIGTDPISYAEVDSRLKLIASCAEQGDLAPATFNPESLECRRCSYRSSICLGKLPVVDDADVIAAAQDYLDGRAQEKEGKLLADQAKVLLVAYAKRKQLSRWDDGANTVSYSTYDREDVSIRRLLEIMPREQFEAAITASPIECVTVTNNKKES